MLSIRLNTKMIVPTVANMKRYVILRYASTINSVPMCHSFLSPILPSIYKLLFSLSNDVILTGDWSKLQVRAQICIRKFEHMMCATHNMNKLFGNDVLPATQICGISLPCYYQIALEERNMKPLVLYRGG